MSRAFDLLHPWVETLDEGSFDESNSEFEIKRGKYTQRVNNQTITVSGNRRGRRLVVTWTDYLTESYRGPTLYMQDVLDIMVREPSMELEGTLEGRDWLGRLLAGIGLVSGWRPTNHPLFTEWKLKRESSEGTTRFERPGYADQLLSRIKAVPPWRIGYLEKTGVDAYWLSPPMMKPGWLEEAVELALFASEPV